MNNFRKFLIGITVAAAAGCLCGAVACDTNEGSGSRPGVFDEDPPAYYKLDLDGRLIDIVFDGDLAEPNNDDEYFKFGGQVMEGVEVRFKVLVSLHATGTPEVRLAKGSLAAEKLTADSDGYYSFTMDADSTISVTGLKALHTLTFHKTEEIEDEDGNKFREERRIKFLDEKGNEIDEEVEVVDGESLKFKLWVSPYYKQNTADKKNYTVSIGSEVLEQDANGFYTVGEVGADGEIDVWGLTMEESFANVEIGTYGDGSAEHPFELRKPVDLYYLAVMVNDDFNTGNYAGLHYKLMNDIDMQGEQLYVIGDNSNDYAVFSGTFDGNGHTISNFFITDEVYNQETFKLEYLPYVGLFGYAVATIDGNNNIVPTQIKNLTLKDYTIKINTQAAESGAYVGSLLGYGIGTEITNCNAISGKSGVIDVTNDTNQIVNAGGIVGRLQGAYGTTARGSVSRAAYISSCSADVFMECTGSPHSAGGIVGYLVSADESAIAYVVNSYSKGSLNGAMHAGGIVGSMGRFSSVSNCYSTAQIHASNELDGMIIESYRGAYAGGIAGYAEENTVIAGCYAANYTSASVNDLSAESNFGASYAKTGAFAGYYAVLDPASNANAADYDELIEYGNQTAVASPSQSTFTTLGWNAAEWDFSGALPEIKAGVAPRTVTVKIKNGTTEVTTASVSGYMAISDWYGQAGGLDEYATDSQGRRSWGYFFDEEMTKRVPYGFVPVLDETVLYVGFADYSEAAGRYYVEKTDYADNAYIQLNADGTVEIRSGGLSYGCKYVYDGSKVIIYRSCLAALSYTESELDGAYYAYGGALEDGKLSLSAYLTLVSVSGSPQQVTYTSEVARLSAVKASENFVYGEYKDDSGVIYLFRTNGTGVMTGRNSSAEFTFTPSGEEFVIRFAGTGGSSATQRTVTLKDDNKTVHTINGVTVNLLDKFKGSWKKNANSTIEFTFDGEGYVSLSGGEAVTYSDDGNGAVGFNIGNVQYKATLGNGSLVINGETYYMNDGFTGDWFMFLEKEQFQLSLGGVGAAGYGSATIIYTGGESLTLEAEYDVFTSQDGKHLRIYVGDGIYGDLLLNAESKSASGTFYSQLYGEFRSYDFNIYDALRGVWTGDSDNFDTVTFNGRSAAANGSEVAVRTTGNATRRGSYSFDGKQGTMTVGGVTYNIVYSEAENRVSFTEVKEEQPASGLLGRRDGWYGVELTDGALKYKFDGKSRVGGNVIVSDGTKLAYTVSGDTVTVGGMAFTATAAGFTWNGKTLTFDTGFADSWLVPGGDSVLTVNEVGGNFTADVAGKAYVYDPVAKTLTLTEGETVTVMTLMGDNELSITRTDADGNAENSNCVRNSKADKWKGEYTSTDGAKWKFDGLGVCIYGNGTAIYTPADGDPVKYTYKVNALGNPYIRGDENLTFIEADGGEYSNGGKSYKTVAVDMYYGRTVSVTGDTNTYFFDGNSTVWAKPSGASEYSIKAYTYEIVTSVRCELIDGDGVRRNGEVSAIGMNIALEITDQLEAVMGGKTYAFGVNTVWLKEGNVYTKAYDYVAVDEDKKTYTFTDTNGGKFNAKVTLGEDGETYGLTLTPVEEKDTSGQA